MWEDWWNVLTKVNLPKKPTSCNYSILNTNIRCHRMLMPLFYLNIVTITTTTTCFRVRYLKLKSKHKDSKSKMKLLLDIVFLLMNIKLLWSKSNTIYSTVHAHKTFTIHCTYILLGHYMYKSGVRKQNQ